MAKSNWVVLAAGLMASIIMMCLWSTLGFRSMATFADFGVSLAWCALAGFAIYGMAHIESKRRAKMRVAFVADGSFYIPESGVVNLDDGEGVLGKLASTLSGLSYSEDASMPEEDVRQYRWVVQSSKFEDGGNIWQGRVIPARGVGYDGIEFSSKEELGRLIGSK